MLPSTACISEPSQYARKKEAGGETYPRQIPRHPLAVLLNLWFATPLVWCIRYPKDQIFTSQFMIVAKLQL